MHSRVRIGRGPIIAPPRQDRDRQFARLSYFLMNTGEFAERREVVKDSKHRQAFNSLYFFMASLEYVLVNVIASTVTRRGTRFFERFSKLVE
jgi:hypothetical protein